MTHEGPLHLYYYQQHPLVFNTKQAMRSGCPLQIHPSHHGRAPLRLLLRI